MEYYSVPVKEVVERYKKLYTGVVSDAMDKLGMREHLLPIYLRPIQPEMVVAGPAFTGEGRLVDDVNNNDNQIRFAMLESIQPYDVPVWQANDDGHCAEWGGMMTRSTRQGGGTGAVIDGGVRDVNDILSQGFPVFTKYYSAGSSLGRWEIVSYQKPIVVGGITVNPGDFIFGDVDGLLAVPKDQVVAVLERAEEMAAREDKMTADLGEGMGIRAAYDKYGVI